MTKIKISSQFRKSLSEKLMDLGNITAGALVIGQLVSGKEFSLPRFMGGIVVALSCYTVSYIVSK